MKDIRLADLNFRRLLDYGGQPAVVRNKYAEAERLKCSGFCVSCESHGFDEEANGELTLMSHGCDSSDFEAPTVLGRMPSGNTRAITDPVLFLLENPGGEEHPKKEARDYEKRKCGRFEKQIPTGHYYWTPNIIAKWPESFEDIGSFRFYGNYFAYIMRRLSLRSVYITNLVKCKWIDPAKRGSQPTPSRILKNCTENFLSQEITLFKPRLALCFGKAALAGLGNLKDGLLALSNCQVEYVWHPNRFRFVKKEKRKQAVEEQIRKIAAVLKPLANSS